MGRGVGLGVEDVRLHQPHRPPRSSRKVAHTTSRTDASEAPRNHLHDQPQAFRSLSGFLQYFFFNESYLYKIVLNVLIFLFQYKDFKQFLY